MLESMKEKDQVKFEHCKESIRTILEAIKKEEFTNPQNATDAEAMGLLVSKFFSWDGVEILHTSFEALKDANFHTEAGMVQDMIRRNADEQRLLDLVDESCEGCEAHGTGHLYVEWVDGVSQGMTCKACEEEGAEYAQPCGDSTDPVRLT